MIHPSAIIHPAARLGADCQIGPYCIVGEHVELGAGCQLRSHVVIDGHTKLGRENVIYPFASIGLKTQDLKWKGGITRTDIGDHNTFRENVTIHSATSEGDATRIGSHNNFLAYTHVAHDCQLGDHIIMSNNASLAGHVIMEDHVIMGGFAAVHQFCRLGKMAMIGGYSRIVQDAVPFTITEGNPAAPRTINKIGLQRNGVSDEAQTAIRHAYKILFREGLTVTKAIEQMEAQLPPSAEIKHLIEFVRKSERGITR
jgi:UDP-N-acetylglucosamine acyltransferase